MTEQPTFKFLRYKTPSGFQLYVPQHGQDEINIVIFKPDKHHLQFRQDLLDYDLNEAGNLVARVSFMHEPYSALVEVDIRTLKLINVRIFRSFQGKEEQVEHIQLRSHVSKIITLNQRFSNIDWVDLVEQKKLAECDI